MSDLFSLLHLYKTREIKTLKNYINKIKIYTKTL